LIAHRHGTPRNRFTEIDCYSAIEIKISPNRYPTATRENILLRFRCRSYWHCNVSFNWKNSTGTQRAITIFFALLGCFLWIYAFLIEAVTVVPKILRNTIFLALLGIVSILVLKATNIWIGRVINELTGADPDELPDASAALLVVFVPIAWIYVASALTIVSLLVMLTAGTIWTMLFHSKEQAVSFLLV